MYKNNIERAFTSLSKRTIRYPTHNTKNRIKWMLPETLNAFLKFQIHFQMHIPEFLMCFHNSKCNSKIPHTIPKF